MLGVHGGQKRALLLLELQLWATSLVVEPNPGPLYEQQLPLNVEPFLQPQILVLYRRCELDWEWATFWGSMYISELRWDAGSVGVLL